MKHRVTIQTVSRASDGQGGFTETWNDVTDVWVSIEPVKGWERYQAQQLETPVTHKIMMRYRSLSTKDRLVYGARTFIIKEVLNVNEENRFLQIKAMEKQT